MPPSSTFVAGVFVACCMVYDPRSMWCYCCLFCLLCGM